MSTLKNHHDLKQTEALLRSLEYELLEHNEYFDRLVDMIPSKLYVAGASGDDCHPAKYLKGSHADSKPARRAAAKEAKRRKLDPSLAESTVEIKARIEASHDDSSDDDDDIVQEATRTCPVVLNFPPAISAPYTSHQPGLSRIEILKKRLHDKIQQQQGRPRSSSEQNDQKEGSGAGTSKRAARRAEKLRRREEAQKRADSSKSAVDTNNNSGTTYKVKEAGREAVDPARDLKHLDFGRLAGFQSETSMNYLEMNKALGGLAKNNKNLQKMLTEAEKKKQKLEKLKDGTEEEKNEPLRSNGKTP